MPVVHITLVEGRNNETIEKCIRNVAETISKDLNAPTDSIRVMVNEVPSNRFSVGQKLKSD